MIDIAAILRTARTPDGGQRFYPPGQHPAGAQLRTHLRALRDYQSRHIDTPELIAAIIHAERDLAALEVGEDRAKREYIRVTEGAGRD
jgi:hypothetical protein